VPAAPADLYRPGASDSGRFSEPDAGPDHPAHHHHRTVKGWLVDPINSTQVRATQKWRTHSATVIISTDGRTYSINYEGSANLLQQGGTIHREYNERVHALEDAIEKRLHQRP
jgi:hypothetical protein